MIRECEFETLDISFDSKSPFSIFFLQKNINYSEILNAVYYDDWFGLLSIDIRTPDSVKKRFNKINFGTLFDKIVVKEDMLSDMQKKYCKSGNMKFPLQPQLVRIFNRIY